MRTSSLAPWIMAGLGGMVVIGFLACLAFLIRSGSELSSPAAAGFATLGTLTAAVVQYYFGSSQGSRDKDERSKPDA